MALIESERYSEREAEAFWNHMRVAEVHGRLARHARAVEVARLAVREFVQRPGGGYAGVSWGKDSVAMAHLLLTEAPQWPLCWVRVEPIANPDCHLVRDAFLSRYPSARYVELEESASWSDGEWHASGTLERGFARARAMFGERHMSGIRAAESGLRSLRVATHGLVSRHASAPIGRWSDLDLWAYTLAHDLPIHPAYACLLEGHLDPSRVRVASIGGERGTGWGRREWEQRYYPDAMRRLRSDSSA